MIPQEDENDVTNAPRIVVSGAGIIGLTLAIGLKTKLGLTAELYEQAEAFEDDVGAGMGMYANGLRVIRDFSPELLDSIRKVSTRYEHRKFEVRANSKYLE
jgi:2-polyprenyl-6-methoxyphenol hydroxylase-like FAD-dependent oxidoreductase